VFAENLAIETRRHLGIQTWDLRADVTKTEKHLPHLHHYGSRICHLDARGNENLLIWM
jgi:hypothetical protein